MTVPKSGSQVKYELLEENERTAIKTSHIWLAVLLVILIVCSSIISLFMTWQHMLNSSKERDNMDFLMFGPTRSVPGYSRMFQLRGEMYGLAKEKMRSYANWPTTPQLEIQKKSEHDKPFELKRICYFVLPSYGAYHENEITPDIIPPDLCTHINVAFATVENGTLQPSVPADVKVYKSITALKEKNPQLKVLLSVEWFTSSGEFAWVVSTHKNRTRFVDSAVNFLERNRFDGLDIDWEFPSWPTVVENQTNCFTELLQHLSGSFRQREHSLLLSVAVGAPKPIIDQSYNITAMSEYIDYVNVMAYDYHMYQAYLPLTGANSPLYVRQEEKGYFTTLNVNWTASYWLFKGMPASKIIIGIPTYGHSFMLVNEENHGWDAPSSGVGSVGSDGFTAYNQVCGFMGDSGVQAVFDYESKVPYAFKNKEWISYENEQSVAYKAEFAKQNMFGGVMIFSLNTDDVTASCDGQTRFPLAERVKNVLQDDQL